MEIPLFPLPDLVLFPGIVQPLHIFEDRYKLMISNALEKDEAFGLICLKSNALEENEASMHRVGVSARVIQVERLDDGRMNILCQGESRFRVYRFTQQVPYWKASVDFFGDDDESVSSLRPLYNEVAALYRKAFAIGTRLGATEDQKVDSDPELPESPTELSYMMSYVLDLEAEEKQRLLEMTSTSERLHVLVDAVAATITKLEQRLAHKGLVQKVRGNGDLGWPEPDKGAK
jgi:Lon protease-like protein